jgi:hypothetical protein
VAEGRDNAMQQLEGRGDGEGQGASAKPHATYVTTTRQASRFGIASRSVTTPVIPITTLRILTSLRFRDRVMRLAQTKSRFIRPVMVSVLAECALGNVTLPQVFAASEISGGSPLSFCAA